MKRGIDTNVLIYAHFPIFEDHPRVRRFLLGQLQDPEVVLVLTPGVLHEWVHIVTDARRFDPPLVMEEAIALARGYLDKSNIEVLSPSEESLLLAFEMIENHKLGRRRIADTLLAATLLEDGAQEIITCNPRDFALFEGLKVIDPRIA